jgi:hypothetical protein
MRLDELVLHGAIDLRIPCAGLRGLALDARVFLGDRVVRPQIIPERKVASNTVIAMHVGVDLMRPVQVAALEVEATGNAVFPLRLVAQPHHRRLVQRFERLDFEQDVDHGLRGEPGHGRAADVMDLDQDRAERFAQTRGFAPEVVLPCLVVTDDPDPFPGHCAALPVSSVSVRTTSSRPRKCIAGSNARRLRR